MSMMDIRDRPRGCLPRASPGSPRRLSAARDDIPLRHCERSEAIQRLHSRFRSHERITNVHRLTEAEHR